jgi:hypothetical protein
VINGLGSDGRELAQELNERTHILG